MKRAYLTCALMLSAAAASATDPSQRLMDALAVEFMMARCDGELPALTVMTAGMVLNGNDARVVEERREEFRKEMQARFKTRSEACSTLMGSIK